MTSQQRVVWLLVPDSDRGALLVDGEGQLPSLTFELPKGDSTLNALGGALAALGLRVLVVDVFIDQMSDDDEPVAAVAELAALDAPPEGMRWRPITDITATIHPGLDSYLSEWLEESLGVRQPPPTRSPWCVSGWYERAIAWIETALAEAGRAPIQSVTRVRQWGISSVMRIDTTDGCYWFKAVSALFFREPLVTAALFARHPSIIPPVVAIERDECWLLLGHLPGETGQLDADTTKRAVATLVELQQSYIGRTDELLAAGFTPRPFDRLAAELDIALALPSAGVLDLTSTRRDRAITGVEEALVAVEALGIPHTLAHGDFHPGNVLAHEDHLVIFDWSDAAATHPLVDIAVWAWWTKDDPAAMQILWQTFADSWAGIADPAAILAARPQLEVVHGAFHSISYAHLIESVEPRRRDENARGLNEFFGLLEDALARVS